MAELPGPAVLPPAQALQAPSLQLTTTRHWRPCRRGQPAAYWAAPAASASPHWHPPSRGQLQLVHFAPRRASGTDQRPLVEISSWRAASERQRVRQCRSSCSEVAGSPAHSTRLQWPSRCEAVGHFNSSLPRRGSRRGRHGGRAVLMRRSEVADERAPVSNVSADLSRMRLAHSSSICQNIC